MDGTRPGSRSGYRYTRDAPAPAHSTDRAARHACCPAAREHTVRRLRADILWVLRTRAHVPGALRA